ncbi:hypothetical protein HPB48_005502 [Haemaphysalis longicornis]|uniref:Uncharacterized protein n=1 Tax=Haemaphysalis longicornis TaxID=44386 RepID=A0A9J6H2N1_HAELO|nr:hypothetical protein HPB48_005502 [Haemaphysalis longicornis]
MQQLSGAQGRPVFSPPCPNGPLCFRGQGRPAARDKGKAGRSEREADGRRHGSFSLLARARVFSVTKHKTHAMCSAPTPTAVSVHWPAVRRGSAARAPRSPPQPPAYTTDFHRR